MDVKNYFRKIRDMEASIEDRFLVVISNATVDGGQAGIYSEVPRFVACQLVVEGRARLASAEEAEQYRVEQRAAFEEFERTREDNRGNLSRPGPKPSGKGIRN